MTSGNEHALGAILTSGVDSPSETLPDTPVSAAAHRDLLLASASSYFHLSLSIYLSGREGGGNEGVWMEGEWGEREHEREGVVRERERETGVGAKHMNR